MENEKYTGFFVHKIEQWSQYLQKCGWYDFDLINISFENDVDMGAWQLTIIVFGLGGTFLWNHTETDTVKYIKSQARKYFDFEEENGK